MQLLARFLPYLNAKRSIPDPERGLVNRGDDPQIALPERKKKKVKMKKKT